MPYSLLVDEARRVGISHPEVFNGNLRDLFSQIDHAHTNFNPNGVSAEGYIVRTFSNSKYYKIKYPEYSEALTIVNRLRANRFITDYYRASEKERVTMLSALPTPFKEVALQQLRQVENKGNGLIYFLQNKLQHLPTEKPDRLNYIKQNIPEELQAIAFRLIKGQPYDKILETLAVKAYYDKLSFNLSSQLTNLRIPLMMAEKAQISNEHIQLFDRVLYENATFLQYMNEAELMQELESAREQLNQVFGNNSIPEGIIRGYLEHKLKLYRDDRLDNKQDKSLINYTIQRLAEIRPADLRIFVNELAQSTDYKTKLDAAESLYYVYGEEEDTIKILGEIANAYFSKKIEYFPLHYFEKFENCSSARIKEFFADLDAKLDS